MNFILFFFIGIILRFDTSIIVLLIFLFMAIIIIRNLISERIVFKKISKQIGFQTFGLSTVSLAILLDAYLSGAKIEFLSTVVIVYFITNLFSIYSIKKREMIVE
ncbi:MAG TPA: hypothetical protein ENL21_04760 [Caldithrix abyssi]|uniref:Uncharacterized protein n=1 Tax=Caldithrix abyssi TaxID=187145 RepID=A0A7V5H3X3_CALAY|nr:hypothetical protein [Caldithrix abyssi]